jgi:hypothetical protein
MYYNMKLIPLSYTRLTVGFSRLRKKITAPSSVAIVMVLRSSCFRQICTRTLYTQIHTFASCTVLVVHILIKYRYLQFADIFQHRPEQHEERSKTNLRALEQLLRKISWGGMSTSSQLTLRNKAQPAGMGKKRIGTHSSGGESEPLQRSARREDDGERREKGSQAVVFRPPKRSTVTLFPTEMPIMVLRSSCFRQMNTSRDSASA